MLPPGYPTSKKIHPIRSRNIYTNNLLYNILDFTVYRSFIFVFNQVWTLWFKKISLSNVASSMVLLHIFDEIVSPRDKRVTEIDYQLKYAIFSTAFSTVYMYCTRPISKHLYSGIFQDPFDTKQKIFQKNTEFIYVMFHI